MAHKPLHHIFTAVPASYDLVNRIVTWGLDQRWRRKAARFCLAAHPARILDLACGTGDLALMISRLARCTPELTGLDYSAPMLEIARKKAGRRGGAPITFITADAAALPFSDCHFDCIGTAFAFRNLSYRNPLTGRVLDEVLRVLRPGGQFVIVESSQPGIKIIRRLFHWYLRFFVANVGRLLSGQKAAYHYLAQSAIHFFSPEEVTRLLQDHGFCRVVHYPLFFGAAAVHVAGK